MKELSIEQKAKAYDEALERAKGVIEQNPLMEYLKKGIEYIFPELKESEDERIINLLKMVVEKWNNVGYADYVMDIPKSDILAWLEKQGEKKPDKVEPKFHEGDWVIDKEGIMHQIANVIENVTNHTYGYDIVGGGYFNDTTEGVKLWTIQDAKDGDVLCCESGWTCIFKALNNHTNTFSSYCFMDSDKWFCKTGCEGHSLDKAFIKAYNGEIHPATKKQRDLLFQKMKESGYEWNAEKKELKKIEQKPAMIQWKGDNLKEVVDFTGVYKEGFEKWFHNSWEEYEKYVHEHNNIFKIFNEDGSHMEIPVGAWIIKAPDGYNTASRFAIVQPKQEWSEKDKERIEQICDDLKSGMINFYANEVVKGLHYKEIIESNIEWLKFLRPQNTWKPSDEHIHWLKWAINRMPDTEIANDAEAELRDLLEQLNKLREE